MSVWHLGPLSHWVDPRCQRGQRPCLSGWTSGVGGRVCMLAVRPSLTEGRARICSDQRGLHHLPHRKHLLPRPPAPGTDAWPDGRTAGPQASVSTSPLQGNATDSSLPGSRPSGRSGAAQPPGLPATPGPRGQAAHQHLGPPAEAAPRSCPPWGIVAGKMSRFPRPRSPLSPWTLWPATDKHVR